MKPSEFRKAVMANDGVAESQHMGHPDFRFNNKIFATVGAPSDEWAVVKLTPEQQNSFVRSCPDVFIPCNGAWGRSGSTLVHLALAIEPAKKSVVKAAIQVAYENLAERNVIKKTPPKRRPAKTSNRRPRASEQPIGARNKKRR